MHHLMEQSGDNVRQFANTFQNAARDAVNAHMNLTREATTASRGVPFPFEVSRPPEASASSFFNPVNSGPNDLQEASFGGDQHHSSSCKSNKICFRSFWSGTMVILMVEKKKYFYKTTFSAITSTVEVFGIRQNKSRNFRQLYLSEFLSYINDQEVNKHF